MGRCGRVAVPAAGGGGELEVVEEVQRCDASEALLFRFIFFSLTAVPRSPAAQRPCAPQETVGGYN